MRRLISPELLDDIRAEAEAGANWAEIAERLRLRPNTVYRLVTHRSRPEPGSTSPAHSHELWLARRAAGLPPKPPAHFIPKQKLNYEQAEEIRVFRMRNPKVRRLLIAQKYGVCVDTIDSVSSHKRYLVPGTLTPGASYRKWKELHREELNALRDEFHRAECARLDELDSSTST